MICNKCKKEIDDNSKFCDYCGNVINEKKKPNNKNNFVDFNSCNYNSHYCYYVINN